MKREILFRGLRIDGKGWVYGDFYHGLNHCIYINTVVQINENSKYNEQIMVNPDTVGQYTGLLDKNGVKIFEGDVVRFKIQEFPEVGVLEMTVIFISGVFGVAVRGHELQLNDLKELEVISNIHES